MGGSKAPTAEKVSASQAAADREKAASLYDPQAAQRNFQIQSNPDYGVGAMSQLYQNAFNQINPQHGLAENDLYTNLLTSLQNPYAITPQQETAVNNIRQREVNRLQTALNTQSNLGGGLYGGHNFNMIGQQLGNLSDQFSNEDINLIRQQDQLNKSNLFQLMGMTPKPGVVANNYQSSVADPNAIYQGGIQQNQFPAQMQAQQQDSRNALLGSLFQGVGTAAGGYFGRPRGDKLGGSLGSSLAGAGGTGGGYGLTGALGY